VNLLLFGPPGSGKGTQGDILVKKFNLVKISTGDLLREEIKKKTPLGNEINTLISKGNLAPDHIVDNLIEKTISNKNYYNRFIFDGYPRNLNQAKNIDSLLQKSNQKISSVISLKIDKDTVTKRILGRIVCSKCGLIFNEYFYPPKKDNHNCSPDFLKKRSDDNERTISARFDVYLKETVPILDYYQKQNLLREINAMNDIDRISQQICDIITSLET